MDYKTVVYKTVNMTSLLSKTMTYLIVVLLIMTSFKLDMAAEYRQGVMAEDVSIKRQDILDIYAQTRARGDRPTTLIKRTV